MKLHFDSNQEYQWNAIKSITDIFEVAETKSDGQELLKSEKLKIKCGKEHFKNFDGVVYKQVTAVKDLSE
ncbi:MAG: hypothetical protein M3Q97_09180 [Bacteroidota bacterium]|nr:hypothetical protein [Bacteroidota bacterium]